jgi:hypothetical protein
MKTLIRLCGALALLLSFACHGSLLGARPEVEVEVRNQSALELRNVRVVFGDFVCAWGQVGPTFSKSYLAFPHPITADARFEWEEQGRRRSQPFDLRPVYVDHQAGRLTFTVSGNGVSVAFKPKPPR